MWLNVNVFTQSSPSRGEKVLCFELLHIVIPTGVTAIAGPAVSTLRGESPHVLFED